MNAERLPNAEAKLIQKLSMLGALGLASYATFIGANWSRFVSFCRTVQRVSVYNQHEWESDNGNSRRRFLTMRQCTSLARDKNCVERRN